MANRRRGSGKKNHSCGHVGKGIQCRRCVEAVRYETMAEKGTKFVTNKKQPKQNHKVWTANELVAEAKRLRSPRTARSRVYHQPEQGNTESSGE